MRMKGPTKEKTKTKTKEKSENALKESFIEPHKINKRTGKPNPIDIGVQYKRTCEGHTIYKNSVVNC